VQSLVEDVISGKVRGSNGMKKLMEYFTEFLFMKQFARWYVRIDDN